MAWPRAFPSRQESSGASACGNMQEAARLNPDTWGLLSKSIGVGEVELLWGSIQRNHSYCGKLTQKADSNLLTYSSVQQTFTDATACKTLGHQTGSSLPELQSGRGERDRYGRWIKISHSHPLSPTPFSATWHQKVMTEKHGFTSCFEIPYPLYLFLIQLCGVNIIISTWYRNNKTGDKTGVNIYWALIVHQALNYFTQVVFFDPHILSGS